jgi:hypothetical protein
VLTDQDWSWTEGEGDPGFPHAANKFSPTYSGFDIDAFYTAVANASLDLHQCLQARPWFLSHGNTTEVTWKPVPDVQIYNVSAIVDPSSYVAHLPHAPTCSKCECGTECRALGSSCAHYCRG